ncbi:MAG TPA: hypothetical protein VGM90_40885 [Kofleriaceae bacterium]|jgi:uncharacterized protein YtpQ (UPF0354 family)
MRRLLVVALVIAFGCKGKEERNAPPSSSAEHGAVSGDAVVERLKAGLTAAMPGVTLSMTADDRMLVGAGSGSSSMQLSLDNVRRSCASSEGECADAIAGVVENTKKSAASMETKDEAPPDKAMIRLTPKPTQWLQQADEQMKEFPDKIAENSLPRTKFVGDLWWLYVYDMPSGMRMINNKEMKDLGMTVEQLHAFAVANLAAQYPKLEFSELTPGMWTIEPGDYLDSARLALTDQWRAEVKKLGGTVKVSVPARSRVFVTNDPKLRDGFDKITAKAYTDEDHPLSQMTIVWTDKGWALDK